MLWREGRKGILKPGRTMEVLPIHSGMEIGIAYEEGGAKEAEGHNNKQFTKIPIRDDKVELLGYYYDNKLVKMNSNNELNCVV